MSGQQPHYPVPFQPQRPARGEGALPAPVAVDPVPGTPFGVAVVGVAPTTSGPASASLVAGIGAILVSFVVGCFAAVGAQPGWGPVVAGAFAVLAALVGLAAIVLGRLGIRQVRRNDVRPYQGAPDLSGPGPIQGRGLAVAGTICGGVGLALTGLAMALAVLI